MLGTTASEDAAAAGTAGPQANAGAARANAVILPDLPRGKFSTRGELERLLNQFVARVTTTVSTA